MFRNSILAAPYGRGSVRGDPPAEDSFYVIECVPNFSEGRDAAKVRAIVDAIAGVAGVLLLGYESDADHNRSVVTFAGPSDAVMEAAIRGAGRAAEVIDLSQHEGVHPRVGVADVIPFVPLAGATIGQSGLITFASSAGALVMKPATQTALRWFGFRDTLVWNGLLSAVMIGLCAAFRPTWPAAAIYGALLIGGFFRSLQFTAYNTLAYGDVPRSRMSSATSLYVTCQQLAATIGISAGAVSLEISMVITGHATPQPIDFSHAFLVVAMFTLVAAPIALLMPRNAGDELTGRQTVSPQPAREAAD